MSEATPAIAPTTFDHVQLNEIELGFKALPEDVYTLQIQNTGIRTYTIKTPKNGRNVGDTAQFASIMFGVTGHESLSGRKVFGKFYPDAYGLANLKRLANVVGIEQAPGESIEDWLGRLKERQPRFITKVNQRSYVNAAGDTVVDNEIDFKTAQVAN